MKTAHCIVCARVLLANARWRLGNTAGSAEDVTLVQKLKAEWPELEDEPYVASHEAGIEPHD
jgi:hypothetical protein